MTVKMADMRKTQEERVHDAIAMPMGSEYPWGLCLRLSKEELDKMDVDHKEWEIGDIYHIHAMAKVTSISASENESSGECCNVEMQVIAMGAESEDAENSEEDEDMPSASRLRGKMYSED